MAKYACPACGNRKSPDEVAALEREATGNEQVSLAANAACGGLRMEVAHLGKQLAEANTRVACLETMIGSKAIETLNDLAEAQARAGTLTAERDAAINSRGFAYREAKVRTGERDEVEEELAQTQARAAALEAAGDNLRSVLELIRQYKPAIGLMYHLGKWDTLKRDSAISEKPAAGAAISISAWGNSPDSEKNRKARAEDVLGS